MAVKGRYMNKMNFYMKEFSEDVQQKLKSIDFAQPRVIIGDDNKVAAVVMHPDQYSSMCDQIADMGLMTLAIKRLTGVDDPAKLSSEEFLKACGLDDDSYIDAECTEE